MKKKVADENKTEVSNSSISVGLLDFDTFNPIRFDKIGTVKECMEFVYETALNLTKNAGSTDFG